MLRASLYVAAWQPSSPSYLQQSPASPTGRFLRALAFPSAWAERWKQLECLAPCAAGQPHRWPRCWAGFYACLVLRSLPFPQPQCLACGPRTELSSCPQRLPPGWVFCLCPWCWAPRLCCFAEIGALFHACCGFTVSPPKGQSMSVTVSGNVTLFGNKCHRCH